MKIKIISILIVVFVLFSCGTSNTSGTANPAAASQDQAQNHFNFPLKTIYQDYFPMGNIVNNNYLRGEAFEILKAHFNVVTSENNMKPDHLAPRERGGQYNWTSADNQVRIMAENGIRVHGHTLVWHTQTHRWMTEGTPEQVRQNLVNHIITVLAHFKGRITSWDVVNEAVRERVNPGENYELWRNHLRTESGWLQALGPDYIEIAFRAARAADPDVKLYYNDYNLDNSRKAQVVANMIRDINAKYRAEGNTRNLIEGVGMQAHYGLTTSVPGVRASMDRFIAIGIEISISELDVEVRSVGSGSFGTGNSRRLSEMEQRQQAIKYAELFLLFKEYKDHIARVTLWGIDDEHSWKSLGNPCLWDARLRPKQAFFAVVDPAQALGL